ncbi:MAG: Glycosyltransferase [Candidatus Pacebacteria bacterium GW2011_GWF2_38_9]|nr:MAG: Glycosyltransferase [Candidatus Pacebacteria bacterium GW2011_GWF1_36_5]KKQ88830.1 MAG: Glycosyltransferase [Candidatus Pacebacteria bacterium GW2011_GWF2_38_9]
MKKLKSLSVFFPVYNEESNLEILIEQALRIIPSLASRYELLIINDGSTDDSLKIANKLANKHEQVKVLSHETNKGYGEVLKTGIKNSQYEWIFWTDSDLQFDLSELANFVKETDENKVILGYRKKRAEGFRRHLNASLFGIYIDLLFRIHVKDIDCAFKLIQTDLLKNLKLTSGSAFTSAEILYRLKKKKLKFKEIAVNHYPRIYGQATGANLKVIIKACYEALRTYLQIKFTLN